MSDYNPFLRPKFFAPRPAVFPLVIFGEQGDLYPVGRSGPAPFLPLVFSLVYQESRGLVNAAGASSPLFTNLLGGGVPKTSPFEVPAEEAGSLVDVVYAVTQSTT